jgi:NAD-dependent dihydropyrimidine dehydrogenase PreA subunit
MSNAKDPNKPYGPVTTNGLTVTVDKDLCIGAATCVAIAPQTFLLDSEAKAIILDTADQDFRGYHR